MTTATNSASSANGTDPVVGDEEWISALRAGKLLGETRSSITNRIVNRELVGKIVAGRMIVTRASVEAILANRRAGYPRRAAR